MPAAISSFVLARIGAGPARRYFLTGERFDAADSASNRARPRGCGRPRGGGRRASSPSWSRPAPRRSALRSGSCSTLRSTAPRRPGGSPSGGRAPRARRACAPSSSAASQLARLAAVRAASPSPRRGDRLRRHDVLRGADAAPAPLRRPLRPLQARGGRPRRRVSPRRPRRRYPERPAGGPGRRQADGDRRAADHGPDHDCIRLRRLDRRARPRALRAGNRERLRLDGEFRLVARRVTGRATRGDDRDHARDGDRRGPVRPRARRRRLGHRHARRLHRRRRPCRRARRVGVVHPRTGPSARPVDRPAPSGPRQPARAAGTLVRDPARPPLRHDGSARAAPALGPRLRCRRDRWRLSRRGGVRGGAGADRRPGLGSPRPSAADRGGTRRIDGRHGAASPGRARGPVLGVVVIGASMLFGTLFTPAMSLLIDAGEKVGLHYALAFALDQPRVGSRDRRWELPSAAASRS